MGGSLRVGTAFGIPIRLHITFLLLLPFVAFGALAGIGIPAGLAGIALIVVLFTSVVLHELGHSLVAMSFKIPVREIVLLPIGGMAAIAAMPRKAYQEFLIALAGPAVSFALGFAFLIVASLLGVLVVPSEPLEGNVFLILAVINIGLGTFNLVPAFPLDGGRILRSVLAMLLPHESATRIAVSVGQIAAVVGVVAGLVWQHYGLVLISIFVYFGAGLEQRQTTFHNRLAGVPARDAMLSRFLSVGPDWTLEQLVRLMNNVPQTDFPVVDHLGRLVGVLPRPAILDALRERPPDTRLGQLMSRAFPSVGAETPLSDVLELIHGGGNPVVVVIDDQRMVGLVTPEQLARYQPLRKRVA